MGGRGSKSSFSNSGNGRNNSGLMESGIDVTVNGQTTRYYFAKSKGVNYYQEGVSGIPQPTPLNMSAAQFKHRVLSHGATVKDVTADEYKADMKAQKTYRKSMDAFLNKNWYGVRPRYGLKGH